MAQEGSISYKRLAQHFEWYASGCMTDSQEKQILKNCKELFAKDYTVQIIDNSSHKLCSTYPRDLIIIQSTPESPNVNNANNLRKLIESAHPARVRSRFPIPVLCYKGKNVSRSSTLSHSLECMAKSASNITSMWGLINFSDNGSDADTKRKEDIKLIKSLRIKYICDLMVEDKKQKYGMFVTSSEKTDRYQRYGEFCLTAIPFPGTEFFRSWKDNSYLEKMSIDWNVFGTSSTGVVLDPDGPIAFNSKEWKNWDIIDLSKNYLKLILTYLATPGNDGVLVHCISGWDRTPLYISLIRLSLWADGAIHQHLTSTEILYLTVNYDWNLFKHYLSDRTREGEDIFYFCFVFLNYILDDEFSINTITENANQQTRYSSCKISIRRDDDNEDSSLSGSFGSCGNSWEMTGAYINQFASKCSFISDSTLSETLARECIVSPPSRKTRIKSTSENSYLLDSSTDDIVFPLDEDEEDEDEEKQEEEDDDDFCILPESTTGSVVITDETSESIDTDRASRLKEVRSMMLTLYKQYIMDK